ncbi:hypothetical protein PV327_009620 [Microctonus hyperodae]|uniref:Centrosome-associated protein 350 n=1 Tax=Microctonus hyperodae TaxID=165561 RepID=A0AA39CAT8_MICHY|nr:hypothetical protein PV327_009620 [Microctonus hyperodae]
MMNNTSDNGQIDEQQLKSYVLFNDPDIIVKKAETSAIAALKNQQENLRLKQQQQQQQFVNDTSNNADVNNIGSLFNCCRVQPYPFTFITAVKKKLALAAQHDCARTGLLDSLYNNETLIHSELFNRNGEQLSNKYENIIGQMDFIKPLKVPDLKISPKTLDYSSRENSLQRNVSQKNEKLLMKSASSERAHRKLDFSLSSHGSTAAAFITKDEKLSKLQQHQSSAFVGGLAMKKKEFTRDNSRERENRTKRIKKDDSNHTKGEGEMSQDYGKKMKNLKHIPRKDSVTSPDLISVSKFITKNDRPVSSHRESDFVNQKKMKIKNVGSSNTRKDEERKPRSSSYSMKTSRDRSVENRGRTFNDSMSERNIKISKYSENYQNNTITPKEHQHNKLLDKSKPSTSKIHHTTSVNPLETSNDIDINSKSSSIEASSIYTELSSQLLKAKNERLLKNSQMSLQSLTKSSKSPDNSRFTDKIRHNDVLSSLNVTSTTEDKTNEQKLLSKSNLSDESLLDPRRISFRDNSYSQQDEFCNLVTPDLNLIYRPVKRKDQRSLQTFNEPEKEVISATKYKPQRLTEVQNNDSIPMLHPTALHMQFQAELHLFDSYNESIRQVMDVENSLYNVKQDQEREKQQIQKLSTEEMKKQLLLHQNDEILSNNMPKIIGEKEIDNEIQKDNSDNIDEMKEKKLSAVSSIKMAAVHTQTANDIATQTDLPKLTRQNLDNRDLSRQYPGITYSRGSSNNDLPQQISSQSLNDELDDDVEDQLEEISLPNKAMRTMSEISLHETTSSIKTETGTEISISTCDVTCSFNKYLDLEMAQLIKDEKHMYDKIEMLFKSREKILNDRTRKLVKLEEQKRALRDTGQDSRISSVKKKQRALLLKLQQEKDEMNRLKELHKLASQERKLMLQKQRNMFNPQMSTKNILTKLKRSADCQSPRRLSGPMKGYDIRSNSSISSLIDSDKSQLDRSNFDQKNQLSDSGMKISDQCSKSDVEGTSNIQGIRSNKYPKLMEESTSNSSHIESPQKYEMKTRKFEEKMPKSDALLRLKTHHMELESKLFQARQENMNKLSLANSQDGKSESDTIVEELSKKSKIPRDRENLNLIKKSQYNLESMKGINNKRKGTKNLKGKSAANFLNENEMRFKTNVQNDDDIAKQNKHSKIVHGLLNVDENCPNSILEEINLNDSQNSLQALVKHSRAVKEKNYEILRDIANENEVKENILCDNRHDNGSIIGLNRDDGGNDLQQNLGNISTRSQVSTFTISRHSSGDSEKSYSRSVVIRSQDHQFKTPKKLEQILHAREAALATRRNCVEDWIAWHARLKTEESRVARMEEAAFKLVSATSNVLSCHDTTISSDASDVEGRVELLAEKLSERRAEMAKLKREARRQAKQRLKALEANLLNQIQKYDMTINEMRKKLDYKRGTKDDGKLAIEAKSIVDFKVPEIPIKRIQEIYRNSDLLRSRSESDLITNETCSEVKISNDNSNHIQDNHSTSSLENKSIVDKQRRQNERLIKNQSRSIESILQDAKNISSCRSDTEKVSYFSNNSSSVKDPKTFESDSNKLISHSPSNSIGEEITSGEHAAFSKKIDFLQLNNKNLSDDINTLENDLKTLSEMMSRFSKKSEDKIKQTVKSNTSNNPTIESEKSTSKDITEDLIEASENDEISEDISFQAPEFSAAIETCNSSQKNNSQSILSHITNEITSNITLDEVNSNSRLPDKFNSESKSKETSNVIEQSIISDHIKMSEMNFDLTGAALEKSMQNLHKENEALSSDFNSLEGDIKSISKIISKMAENKRNSNSATDITQSVMSDLSRKLENNSAIQQIVHAEEEKINSTEKISEYDAESSVITKSITEDIEEKLDSSQSQINDVETEHSLDIISKSNIQDENAVSDTQNISHDHSSNNLITSDSFEAPGASNETVGTKIVDKSLEVSENLSIIATENRDESSEKQNEYDISNNPLDIEDTLFIPDGESTNIHNEIDRLINDTSNIKHVDTDELDDILDIIEKENKQENEMKNILRQVPDELRLEIYDDNCILPSNNELNITADVEPVLQKLTEILQEVERNIAKRTNNRESDISSPQLLNKKIIESYNSETSNELINTESQVSSEEQNYQQTKTNNEEILVSDEITKNSVASEINIIKDPEYEDISEESLEVSEILDKSISQKSGSQRSNKIPEKYEAIPKSDDVLRILDEISQQSTLQVLRQSNQHLQDVEVTVQVYGDISPGDFNKHDGDSALAQSKVMEESKISVVNDELKLDDVKLFYNDPDVQLSVGDKNEDLSSESSQDADTPRGVSEIDMDSPRDQNDSRLDIEILDDDLLADVTEKSDDSKVKFQPEGTITTSERDIEIMIDKLRASLEQPGLEVGEVDARLLRLEQLQIELQIKKLEAEEVSFYVREIPNKPPPPYTPPGVGSLSSPEPSPTLPRAVVPSNIEELTAFTEHATLIIYNAKQDNIDIMALEAPPEICQLNKDSNGIAKKDRKIYNTFLFDLCKETIAEVYRSEYEKPGPSWTKPNVKTKPAMKLPKTREELNDYVNKEVATLFGFKTKLQRENMVMRWGRKRRDRVDELLAREAQAEEDEWTKFHHDELAVKNELTVAILDTLIFETTNIVKAAYDKKRRIVI